MRKMSAASDSWDLDADDLLPDESGKPPAGGAGSGGLEGRTGGRGGMAGMMHAPVSVKPPLSPVEEGPSPELPSPPASAVQPAPGVQVLRKSASMIEPPTQKGASRVLACSLHGCECRCSCGREGGLGWVHVCGGFRACK